MGLSHEKEQIMSHIPLLVRVFDKSEGDVLEIGTGYFSTLLLNWLGDLAKRHTWSYENRPGWHGRAVRNKGNYHHVVHCPNWDDADFGRQRWGLVLIDHNPNYRRITEVRRLANLADYIVCHDTEPENDGGYQYSKIFPEFKYVYHYTKYPAWTSVVSNFKDLSNIP